MKISVITPTYNRPTLLEQAIESFLKQDYKSKEMIIINDGGNHEHFAEIGKIYRSNSVKFLEINHKGCPSALNEGIRYISGDFICILADDDLFNGNDSLSRRIASFDSETEVIYTGAINVDVDNKEMSKTKVEIPNKDKIFNKDYINIQSMMWRESIHDKVGYFSEDLINNEDWEWKIRLLHECNVKAVDIFSVRSRYHGQNKSLVNRSDTIECAGKLIKRMEEKYCGI